MLHQVKNAADAEGLTIAAADEYEVVFAPLSPDTGNEVRFIQDTVMVSFAADFAAYDFDPKTETELDKMLKLKDIIYSRVHDPLTERGYTPDDCDIAYGLNDPEFRVLVIDYYKEIKSLLEAVAEIKWALKFIDAHNF